MTTDTKKVKYVYMAFLIIPVSIFCSLCIEFNIYDLLYLVFTLTVMIIYIYLSLKKWLFNSVIIFIFILIC